MLLGAQEKKNFGENRMKSRGKNKETAAIIGARKREKLPTKSKNRKCNSKCLRTYKDISQALD